MLGYAPVGATLVAKLDITARTGRLPSVRGQARSYRSR